MEKLTFHYELSERAKKIKQKNVTLLKANPYIQQFIKQYRFDESFLFDHSGKLHDFCVMMEKCEQCQGLAFCRQPMKGSRLMLHYDGFLMNKLIPCAFMEQEEVRKEHRRCYYEADFAESYLAIDLAKLDITKESKEYLAVYKKATDIMIQHAVEKGMYLWGKPGAGKTYLTAGITNYFAKTKKRIAFVNVPKLIADLKRMFSDAPAMEKKLKHIQMADVVVFDDIGGESVTAWSRDDILLPLLDARMEDKKLTFFTSNYSMEELKQRLALTSNKIQEPVAAERLYERMKTLSDEFFIKGESRRK